MVNNDVLICPLHACAQKFVEHVRAEMGADSAVKDGKFGAMMAVDLCNDGPVTMQIEYPGMCAPMYFNASRVENPVCGINLASILCTPLQLALHREII
jgi:hypothetical protein